MSFFETEKLTETQKSGIELLQQISTKLLDSADELGKLQFQALRASAEAQFDSLKKLAEVRDPQGFMDWQSSFAQPAARAEHLLDFNRQVYDLISKTQAEITKLAERQVEDGTKRVQELVEKFAKNAPAGAEPVVAALRSAVETAGNVYESTQKTAKQVAEIAENGIAAAASAANQATRNAAKAVRK